MHFGHISSALKLKAVPLHMHINILIGTGKGGWDVIPNQKMADIMKSQQDLLFVRIHDFIVIFYLDEGE